MPSWRLKDENIKCKTAAKTFIENLRTKQKHRQRPQKIRKQKKQKYKQTNKYWKMRI